jgi:hypothetical protein
VMTRTRAVPTAMTVIHDRIVASARVARTAAMRIVIRPVRAPMSTSTRARIERV